MLSIIFTILIPIAVAAWIIVPNIRWEGPIVILFGILGGFLSFIMGALLVVGVANLIPGTGEQREDQALQALGTGQQTEGSFFLGTGTVDEEQVVQYVVQDEEGWSSIETQEVDKVKIQEGDFEPTITTVTKTVDHWWLFGGEVGISSTYEIRVPEGTIVQNYVIDVTK